MKKTILLLSFFVFSVNAQVGIGTTTPQGALDITSTTNGVLVPRVALTSKTVAAPVVNPQTGVIPDGTLIWNTATVGTTPNFLLVPGFYYWEGGTWNSLSGTGGKNWSTTGNTGTTTASNFIGTTDNNALNIRTINANRFSFTNTGRLQSYAGGTAGSPTYSWTTDVSSGMFLPAVSNLGFSTVGVERFRIPNANQVHAVSLGTAALPFYSFSTDTDTGFWSPGANTLGFSTTALERMRILANGAVSVNNVAPVGGDLFTVTTDATNNYGINGYNAQTTGSAIYAENSSTTTNFSAIEGATFSGVGGGVFGVSYGTATTTVSPTGVVGQYSGISNTNVRIGVRGYSARGAGNQQLGVLGSYNGSAWGAGVYGLGFGGVIAPGNLDFGVVGWATSNTNYSGYFNGNHVIANGTKSASVGTSKGNQLLYVTESPEVWFEDIGRAKLVNGTVTVKLDPMFLETVFIDNDHPISVFLQEEGDSNGLYVIPQLDGFIVKEKNGGTSNISFSYKIMAKRLHFQDHRFGNDPLWGAGDTRKYNSYATPPPVDYNENVQFQEKQKRENKPALYPEGFIPYEKTNNNLNLSKKDSKKE